MRVSSARRVYGTSTEAGSGTATVSVRDYDGNTDTLTFDWTTYDPLSLPEISSKNGTQNRAIGSFAVENHSRGMCSYPVRS